jgi:GT2 family glycosyltransferase
MAGIEISFIIPNYNGRGLLEKNLPSVIKACQAWSKTSWEIIVVDDASTDRSVDFLKENYPEVKVVVHQKNRRFAAVCNTGVKEAKGRIVILLNNDVSPEPSFLRPLLKNFSGPEVFAVGCKEKDIRGKEIVWSGRGIMQFKRGLMVHWRAKDQNKKSTWWVAGGSGAFDREKWLAIGGMDTLFRPAYEEDRDLSYRALKHGWKISFEPQSVVNHHHETTNITVFGQRKIKIISFKNQFLFVWKNITDWQYLVDHLIWLPYHLVFTCCRSHGLLFFGFLLALAQLPEAVISRRKAGRLFVKKDRELQEVIGV